ncbi:MAG: site-2 protease family protein, partial [Longimicrobiales bacterium]
ASIVPGATLARIGDTAPETWGDVQRAFVDAPPGRTTVVTENPTASFSVAIPETPEGRISLVAALDRWIPSVVGTVNPGSAADEGGLEVGDSLVAVAGVPVESWADMVRELGARPGQEIQLLLHRDGSELMRVVELSEVVDGDTGERRGVLGVGNPAEETRTISVSFGEAVSNGWAQTVGFTRLIVGFVRDLFTFNVSPRSVGSIGTIAQASGQAAASGLDTFLNFMAFFSINLAVLNLLPIPILDGGHLVFLAIELVRGQALSIEQRIRWSQVGLFVVVGIMVWALGNDVLRALGL